MPLRAPACLLLIVSIACGFCCGTTAQAAPTITSVIPRGLQIGETTTLVISGTELSEDCQLILELGNAKQTLKPGAKANRVEIDVALDDSVQAGLYTLRVANASGISGPVMVGVDRLPQRGFTGSIQSLPVAMSGNLSGAQVLEGKLTGKQGQRVVLDVECQRLGGGIKPVVRLYDARGKQIAWSPPRAMIGGDARLEAMLPTDGEYTFELHDELFRSSGQGFFRLKIGDLAFSDLAFPLAVEAGSQKAITVVPTLASEPAKVDASQVQTPGETTISIPESPGFTGARPRVLVSDIAEVAEEKRADKSTPQLLTKAPIAVSGVLASAGEEDLYEFPVKPKQKLRFDLLARQVGSPLDAVVTLRNEKGEQVASGDDRPGSSDPMVDYTVPAGVSKLIISIKDLLGRGGKEFVYRLAVRDPAAPDFALSLAMDKIEVAAGGTQVIPIQVTRSNYNGPIELAVTDQPDAISLQGNVIAPGATIGLLTLSAEGASPQAQLTRVVGRAVEAEPAVLRVATTSDVPGAKYQPRIRNQVGLAITNPAPIRFAWLPGENDQLFLGGKTPVKVQFTRLDTAKGKVRLKLLSSQPMPKKTVKQGNQDVVVDDVDRSLRLEGDATFGADQNEVVANILVPGDLRRQPWDLVLVAELLSPDGKRVLTSIASPVRTLSPVAPFSLALTGESSAVGKAGTGEPGKLTGKIERTPGYTQPVLVTLEKLPKGYTAPQVLVPGEQSDFQLPLTFAYSSKPGEIKNAQLVGVAAPQVATSVRSNPIEVAINIVPGEKPVLEQPREIYEDDEKFVALFTEGGGRAIPDQRDQYSGKYSMRVTPDQKFNANLPGLAVKIREKPGPGEFRYLRFAWKKAQGNSICLQLAHEGKFGPASDAGGREGAKFRYHAGPGAECFGASLQVSDKIPGQFQVVTRDLFVDFGEFTLTGFGFSPVDGQAALYDHIYLARNQEDLELIPTAK